MRRFGLHSGSHPGSASCLTIAFGVSRRRSRAARKPGGQPACCGSQRACANSRARRAPLSQARTGIHRESLCPEGGRADCRRSAPPGDSRAPDHRERARAQIQKGGPVRSVRRRVFGARPRHSLLPSALDDASSAGADADASAADVPMLSSDGYGHDPGARGAYPACRKAGARCGQGREALRVSHLRSGRNSRRGACVSCDLAS